MGPDLRSSVILEVVVDASTVTGLVAVAVPAAFSTVRTGLGFERRLQGSHGSTQPGQHCVQDVVVGYAQETFAHLYRHVAIAEVIGSTGQRLWVATNDVQHVLILRLHSDQPAICGSQAVAAAQ